MQLRLCSKEQELQEKIYVRTERGSMLLENAGLTQIKVSTVQNNIEPFISSSTGITL